MRYRWAQIMVLAMLMGLPILAGCVESQRVSLSVFRDTAADLESADTFDVLPVSGNQGERPLAEKQIRDMVGRHLVHLGLDRDRDRPDLLVQTESSTEQYERYVPPSTHTYVEWYSYRSCNCKGRHHKGCGYVTVPIERSYTSGGYSVVRFRHTIRAIIFERAALDLASQAGTEALPVWDGSITTSTKSPDIIETAPLMIDELFREFPNRSGLPSERIIRLDDPE